ncbi:MAG: hypothetical protein R3A78_11115 [Polyangiales bacterium]|nr:hypothetical protein [Myxococcales bacterium]
MSDNDDIFSALRNPDAVPPRLPVHARVLEQPDLRPPAWVFVCWDDPGGPGALFQMLRQRIEAAFLAELARPATSFEEGECKVGELRLAVFPEMAPAASVAAFGFNRTEAGEANWRETLALLRGESQWVGAPVDGPPHSAWQATVERRANLDAVETALRLRATQAKDGGVWGATPGSLFGALAHHQGWTSGSAALAFHKAEALVVSQSPGVVRWIPPLVFQALADGAGVVLAHEFGMKVAWGLSEPDETGLAPPPVFRLGARTHVPIGLELLRWCVMPLREGEAPPPFLDWLRDLASQGAD